jgi:RNA polymerase sigma-70 factor (ECF subfamily)
MKRLTYQHARKRQGATLSLEELSLCIPAGQTPHQLLEHKELVALLERFLRSLDRDSRDLFLRRYWFFDSVERIAEDFGYSKTKVTTRLYRLRKKLKDYLAKEGQIYVK